MTLVYSRWLYVCLLLAAGCASAAQSPLATAEALVTAIPTPTPVSVAPTPALTTEEQRPLTIWMPDELAPLNNTDAAALLTAQLDEYLSTQAQYRIELRTKKPDGVGGIMETLRAAREVAPGALPDLTLLRRADLLTAIEAGLIQPLSTMLPRTLLSSLHPATTRLGQINGTIYGVPYALIIQHMAYRPDVLSGTYASFEEVLSNRQPLVFPAGSDAGLNIVLLQYLAAGGRISDLENGRLNRDALLTVFNFYASAREADLVGTTLFNYTRTSDYLDLLVNSEINAAVLDSSSYLTALARGRALTAAPLPMPDGEALTLLDGWMWVLMTGSAERQTVAIDLLTWMLDAERQAAYTRAVNVIPAGRDALSQWDAGVYSTFVTQILENTRTLPAKNSMLFVALQEALAAIIAGERTAEEAVDSLVVTE
ncbi:MAG: extracellular solute-binding protein [Anaerolineae bacterium]|nr:extracellular solute-binding protein [Anaerolineae bacterium]